MKPISVRIFGESDKSFPENISTEHGTVGRGLHFMVNGWVLSTQAGYGNYCSTDPSRTGEKLTARTVRPDCEIALWELENDGKGGLIGLDDDTVLGWVPWEAVIEIIHSLANMQETPSEDQMRAIVLRMAP